MCVTTLTSSHNYLPNVWRTQYQTIGCLSSHDTSTVHTNTPKFPPRVDTTPQTHPVWSSRCSLNARLDHRIRRQKTSSRSSGLLVPDWEPSSCLSVGRPVVNTHPWKTGYKSTVFHWWTPLRRDSKTPWSPTSSKPFRFSKTSWQSEYKHLKWMMVLINTGVTNNKTWNIQTEPQTLVPFSSSSFFSLVG